MISPISKEFVKGVSKKVKGEWYVIDNSHIFPLVGKNHIFPNKPLVTLVIPVLIIPRYSHW